MRIPSPTELFLAFSVCIFCVYSWAIVSILEKLPSWLLFLSNLEIVSMCAYAQVFAFLESLCALGSLLILSLLIPARLLRVKFTAHAGAIISLTTLLSAGLYLKPEYITLWGILYVLLLWGMYVLIQQKKTVENFILSFVQRVSTLAYIYLALTVASVGIVVVRNLF